MNEITEAVAIKVRDTVDAGLAQGEGVPIPGQMCVEAAVCYALGLPHGDNPPCVSRSVRTVTVRLNDARWASPATRAAGMRTLALLQLGTYGVLDEREFVRRLALFTINAVRARALRRIGLKSQAIACERAVESEQAVAAAEAAAEEDAARITRAVLEQAKAGRDFELRFFADVVAKILIDMNVPGVQWLRLLETAA